MYQALLLMASIFGIGATTCGGAFYHYSGSCVALIFQLLGGASLIVVAGIMLEYCNRSLPYRDKLYFKVSPWIGIPVAIFGLVGAMGSHFQGFQYLHYLVIQMITLVLGGSCLLYFLICNFPEISLIEEDKPTRSAIGSAHAMMLCLGALICLVSVLILVLDFFILKGQFATLKTASREVTQEFVRIILPTILSLAALKVAVAIFGIWLIRRSFAYFLAEEAKLLKRANSEIF